MDKEEIRQLLYKTGDKKDFVHLHLHSDFSLKDGIGKPNQYAKKALEIGMSALAITDHGSIGAHPSFFMYCRSVNLKPIVGVEMYMQNRRSEVEEYDRTIDELNKKIKILKQFIKRKSASRQVFESYADIIRQILDMPSAEFEDINTLDFSEVKEKINEIIKHRQIEEKEYSKNRDILKKNQHIILIAKNEIGRKNITKIVSDAARNGFYYKPRTALDFIVENKSGIIVTTACLAGIINNEMLQFEDEKAARTMGLNVAKKYKDIFGDDFYIEIMMIDIDKQRLVNKLLLEIAKELDIKFIVTNDVHYIDKDGAKAQEISLMLGSKDEGEQVTMKDKKRLNAMREILDAIGENNSPEHVRAVYNDFIELDRFKEFKSSNKETSIVFDEIMDIVVGKKKFKKVWEFSTKDFWFKDRHQMIDAYIDQGHHEYIEIDDFRQALDNTIKVANKVETWDWDTTEKLPKIDTGNLSSYDFLVSLTREGWSRKAEEHWYDESSEYAKRVKYELSVIRRTQMADYFLIVADYIKYAKSHNVLVGGARGCFVPDSLIRMADNTVKSIQDVQVGDNVKNLFLHDVEVCNKFIYEIEENIVELKFDDKIIKCTCDHKFLTKNRGWVKAINLTDTDEVVLFDLGFKNLSEFQREIVPISKTIKLTSKKIIPYKGKVFDLAVKSDDKSYNVQDIVVHNSSCGSLVCYLLDITNIDPLKHDLLFERFLSMSRSMAIYDLTVSTFKEIDDKVELFLGDDFEDWSNNRLVRLNE